MSFNEKNSKYSSTNNYFRRKGLKPVFKTLVSSGNLLFSEKIKKLDEVLREARMFGK